MKLNNINITIPHLLILNILIFGINTSKAQIQIPLERSYNLNIINNFSNNLHRPHTSVLPYEISDFKNFDTLLTPGCKSNSDNSSWFRRKLYYEHFLRADTSDFYIYADPLLDITGGIDLTDKDIIYNNTRGLHISGGAGNKLSFYTSYYETQAHFPEYINQYIKKYEVAPGMNRAKYFKTDSWDYATVWSYISYKPNKFLNIQGGYGKNFFGDGYRSLLLSDNSYQYPYLKIITRFGKFEYVNLFTSFQNLNTDSILNAPYVWYEGYQKKPATFNYLSMNITGWLQAGLFEGIIWKAKEKTDSRFNANQFIPLILVNTLRYSSLSVFNNTIIGLNLKIQALKYFQLYGQFVADEVIWDKLLKTDLQQNKYAYQAGFKWNNIGGLNNLIMQTEYNQVLPYVYGREKPLQSYTHNNQALAHPLGANFREILTFVNYRYHRIYSEFQFNYAISGNDSDTTHWGSDIFKSDIDAVNGYFSYGNTTGQGIPTRLIYTGLRLGYLFNPKYNLCIESSIFFRDKNNELINEKSIAFLIGIRTKLFNQYFDF